MTDISVTDDDGNDVVKGSIEDDGGDLKVVLEKNKTDKSDEDVKVAVKEMILEDEGEWSFE